MRSASILTIATALLFAHLGCASNRSRYDPDSPADFIDAKGIFVRNTRLRVPPSDADKFEALMLRCVKAAQNTELPEQFRWLCYREAPRHYWIIVFSDTMNGFATPDAFASFARRIANEEGGDAIQDINERLADFSLETEAQVITQQYAAWSTVGGMSTATHPKAHISSYKIMPNASEAFARALTARTKFLADHNYGLPIEGFVIQRGATRQARQIVFPVSWDAYHARDSIEAFVGRLDQASRSEFQRLDQALADFVQGIERFEADFVKELSYSPK